MPKPKTLLDAFHPAQAARITGLSTSMLYYLSREGYLVPSYVKRAGRGRTRYYSYRDLVVARLVHNLLSCGLEIKRLKDGIKRLSTDATWLPDGKAASVRLLASDGNSLFVAQENGTLINLTKAGQLTFAFVLDVEAVVNEVRGNLTDVERHRFTLQNTRRTVQG